MDFNTLTLTLRNFVTAFQGGYERIASAIHYLLATLAAIDIALFAAWWVLDGGTRLSLPFRKMFTIGVWVWICTSFPTLSKAFVDSLVKAGLMAGGGKSNGAELLMDPSRLAGYGLDVTFPLAKKLEGMSMVDGSDMLIFGLGYLAIMAGFFVIAIQVFMAVLEYHLLAALVGILLPFGLLSATKFLAEKAIGAIVASGIKLMVLAFVLSVAEPVIRSVKFAGDEINLNELWSVLLTSCSLALLCWKAPNMASGLLAGSPNLSFTDVGRPATTAAAGGVSVAGAAVGAIGAGSATTAVRHATASSATSGTSAASAQAAGGLAKSSSHVPSDGPKPHLT